MKPKSLVVGLLAVLLLAVGFAWLALHDEVVDLPVALTFQECLERGYATTEGPPRTCTTPEGISYTEGAAMPPATPEPGTVSDGVPATSTSTAACVVGGCSGQLCVEEGDPAVSTCEFKPEYACYRDATCTRQPDGQCGWTQDAALLACLDNPPAPEGSVGE